MSFSNYDGSAYIEVTPDRHGAFIVITGVIGLIWSCMIIAIRVYLRLHLNPPFGWDDMAAVFGTVVGIIQTSVTLSAVHCGIGTRENLLTTERADTALKTLYVSWLLYPIAICSSKVSIALLIARLTRTKHHLWASYGLTTLSFLWGVISLFLVAFQCRAPRPWDVGNADQCSGMFSHWSVIEIVNMIIEALIPCLIILIVWSLCMPLATKITVVLAFSLQLLVVVPTIMRIQFLRGLTSAPQADRTFTLTNSTVLTEVVMHFSLMAATFPCLRKFLQAFDLHMGATTNLTSEGEYTGSNTYTRSGGASYALKSMDRSHSQSRSRASIDRRQSVPSGTMGNTTMISTVGRRRSAESDGSQRVMIRKTEEWEVLSSRDDK
ncbi:hypothetical protein EYZ11_006782 [Aspergillus tanneri]|uniref:Rhodopsin domain-containing protein n=1 Tax=Aspergillus tanneri TaxID=1220188 RepID=A0A4S3JEX8_9EURO|nr:uncharacterized protein ATNIH1004_000153 [Aspergillus tanneri]KAA8651272.1 hypothetical protein ATNIH1004_000153 [Aspergillus tanneri]THC93742.1 hypothetical protein EYZ11_006782 [Aspergillus tanneri]